MAYHWIEDRVFLSSMKSCCSDVVNRLVQSINQDGVMEVKQHLVGSGAKNLITQNANDPVDLDYNLEIIDSGEIPIRDCRQIKEYVKEKFNEILDRVGWGNCQDSTSALTTKTYYFKKGNRTPFSIDLCIVATNNNGNRCRLIHEKTGIAQWDRYYWNEAKHSDGLENRIAWLKDNDVWLEVRDTYLEKKNHYLCQNDHDHPSFIVYIETVNEVYYQYNGGNPYVQSFY